VVGIGSDAVLWEMSIFHNNLAFTTRLPPTADRFQLHAQLFGDLK
jgi:hypothetical protein